MKRIMLGLLVVCLVLVVLGATVYRVQIDRILFAATLFSGVEQIENFNRMTALYPTRRMPASTVPRPFPRGVETSLPDTFQHDGRRVETQAFLDETDTSALLVIEDGRVRYERYMRTGGREVQWLSMSVAKSFLSAVLGVAVAEGHIASIEEPITRYAPSLAGSAYDGVRIKDILQMSSGARWNEDYSDPFSDINRFGRVFAIGGSMNTFLQGMEREREPGTRNLYNSADTQALGLLLTRATGRTVTDYMREKLWEPLGMEDDGYWMVDDDPMEMVFGGLNATARDYAKLGELYRLGGSWYGEQVVPAAWVRASITPDAPHLTPEGKAKDPFPVGYGYQWWIPAGDEGEFAAIGVYNQFVFVNPSRGVVIVKLSAFSDYATSLDESAYRELESFSFFREIVAASDTSDSSGLSDLRLP